MTSSLNGILRTTTLMLRLLNKLVPYRHYDFFFSLFLAVDRLHVKD